MDPKHHNNVTRNQFSRGIRQIVKKSDKTYKSLLRILDILYLKFYVATMLLRTRSERKGYDKAFQKTNWEYLEASPCICLWAQQFLPKYS